MAEAFSRSSLDSAVGKIEQLQDDNYFVWRFKVKTLLTAKGLFEDVFEKPEPVVIQPPAEGAAASAAAHRQWRKKDAEALSVIALTLSPEKASLFINATRAKEVWKELEAQYEGDALDKQIDVGLELSVIAMKPEETVDAYLDRGKSVVRRAAALGRIISERELVYHLVRGLRKEFVQVSRTFYAHRGLKLEDVRRALKTDAEESVRRQGAKTAGSDEKAFKARSQRKSSNKTFRCFSCGKIGHRAADCYQKSGSTGSVSKFPHTNQRSHSKKSAKSEQAKIAQDESDTQDFAFMADLKDTEEPEVTQWMLDSGASAHMTADGRFLQQKGQVNKVVWLAKDGASLASQESGQLRCELVNTGKTVSLRNVLHVPKLKTNLLSVYELTEKDYTVVFKRGKAEIWTPEGKKLCEAELKGKMFIIPLAPLGKEIVTTEELVLQASQAEPNWSQKDLWHKRLGHPNEAYMDLMKNRNMMRGLTYGKEKLQTCEACIQGKMTESPFLTVNFQQSTNKLELLHIDLFGPLPESLNGSRYALTVVDDYSRKSFVAFLKTKDQAWLKFQDLVTRVENEQNLRVKVVRSDNGLEFLGGDFQRLLASKGVRHQKTTADSPSSNGVAERMNRTLIDKARTLLIQAQLPTVFWAEAVWTASYLRNRVVMKDGRIPQEVWTGRPVVVNHLRVFGSVVYYWVAKRKRQKFDPKARKAVFVGYSVDRKAYRVFDLLSKQVKEERNVTFIEKQIAQVPSEPSGKKDTRNFSEFDLTRLTETMEPVHEEESSPEQREEVAEQTAAAPPPEPVAAPPPLPEVPRRGRPKKITQDISQRQGEQMQQQESQLQQGAVRRSARLAAKRAANTTTTEEEADTAFYAFQFGIITPQTFEEATANQDSKRWMDAMQDEIDSLHQHQVWELVDRKDATTKPIKSKWVYRVKQNADGSISKFKARLVAVGCSQIKGETFDETFSPVIRLESLRLLLSIAASERLETHQYDVKTAYLYGDLKEDVFMEQPKGFILPGEEQKVCKLVRSLYGLRQSGRCWHEKLKEVVIAAGFIQMQAEPCIFSLKEGNQKILLGVYVDDLVFASSSEAFRLQVVAKLSNSLELVDMGPLHYVLGLQVERLKHGLKLHQAKFAGEILHRFGMQDCKPVATPFATGLKPESFQSEHFADQRLYQELLGSLMYLMLGTRPELSYAVCFFSQFSKKPSDKHFQGLKRILRYIKGTQYTGLLFKPSLEGRLIVYADASWSGAEASKSITGYLTMVGKSLISWKSKKQSIVALSTCESEIIALCDALKELKWLRGLLAELGEEEALLKPIVLKTDSQSAIALVRNQNQHARTKHIDRRYNFIRDEERLGNIELVFTPTQDMLADFLTKPTASKTSLQKVSEELSVIA